MAPDANIRTGFETLRDGFFGNLLAASPQD
jgi:hypothetical protein